MMAEEIMIKKEPPDLMEAAVESQELLRDALKDSAIAKVLKKVGKKEFKKKDAPVSKQYKDNSRCDICGKILANREGLLTHMIVHSSSRPFPCDHCSLAFKLKKHLTRHTRRVHEKVKRHHCSDCGAGFYHRGHLVTHRRIHTGERPFECSVCKKTFNRQHVLKQHMYIHTGEKPYACVACGYACRDQSTLRKHSLRHTNTQKVFQCTVCFKRYQKKTTLKLHIAEYHANANVKIFHCDICKGAFKLKQQLASHISNVHTKDVQWECSVCGRRFSMKSNLQVHMYSHTHERRFQCDICPNTFKHSAALNKHRKTHSPAPYACSVCGRAFHRKQRLKNHESKMHTARRKLASCPLCNVRFYSENYVRRHMERKHGEGLKLTCDNCGFRSKSKVSMAAHMKRHSTRTKAKCSVCGRAFRKLTAMKRHCLRAHGVRSRETYRKTGKRSSSEVRVKTEEVDIEENALPELPQSEDENACALSEARRFIQDNAARLSSIPEKYFEGFFVARQKEESRGAAVLKATTKLSSIASERTQRAYRPAARARSPLQRATHLERPRRATGDVDYRELASLHTHEDVASDAEIQPKLKVKKKASKSREVKVAEASAKPKPRAVRESTDGGRRARRARTRKHTYYVPKCAVKFGAVQCYSCLKLFPTHEALTEHCREHFTLENANRIYKCPFCSFQGRPGRLGLWRHVREAHNVELNVCSDVNLEVDLETNEAKYVMDLGKKNYKSKKKDNYAHLNRISVEVVPTATTLNRIKSKEIERRNRRNKLTGVLKRKLVRRGDEWVIENDVIPVKLVSLTDDAAARSMNDLAKATKEKEDLTDDPYLEKMKKLSERAKVEKREVFYPCDKCDKVCRAYCGLKTHRRIHNSMAKPYRPKGWKKTLVTRDEESEKAKVEEKRIRDRKEKPMPILKKRYRCDESLMTFFEENIRGKGVEFDQFLKEYRKVEKKAIENVEEELGVMSKGDDRIEDGNGGRSHNDRRKLTIKEHKRRTAQRRREIKAKLRRKIADTNATANIEVKANSDTSEAERTWAVSEKGKNIEVSKRKEDKTVSQRERDTEGYQRKKDTAASQRERDTAVSQRESDTAVSQRESDTAVSQRESDTAVSQRERDMVGYQRERDTAVSQRERDTVVSQRKEDTAVSQRERDTAISQRERDTVVSQRERDTVFSQRKEDTAVSQRNENTAVCQRERDTAVSQRERDTAVSQRERDTAVCQRERDRAAASDKEKTDCNKAMKLGTNECVDSSGSCNTSRDDVEQFVRLITKGKGVRFEEVNISAMDMSCFSGGDMRIVKVESLKRDL